MSNAFIELTQDRINKEIANSLCPQICQIINDRANGHCMRIIDLDDSVMDRLCNQLRDIFPNGNIYILGRKAVAGSSHHITSTKLVELRNPLANGELRPPLVVFIPSNLRTSAEDSFGVATFEELAFTSIYTDIIDNLMNRLPVSLIGYVKDIFSIVDKELWLLADDVCKMRFLLSAFENGIDGETIGASLYELSLIPDFKLFEDHH